LFILSALSKPSAICLPFCLLAIDLIQKREFNRKVFIEKIPFLLVAIVLGTVTVMARREDNFLNSSHAFAWYERIGYAGYALFSYISSFLAPVHQSVIYPYPQNKIAALVSGYAVWLLLAAVIFLFIRSKRYRAIGIIAFFIFNLVLVLQFLPFGEVPTVICTFPSLPYAG
jgi:high-affinity Fe2+/Pb2+ permease